MNFITKNKFFLLAMMLFAVISLTSCKDEPGNGGNENEDGYGYNFTDVLSTYVDDVVITTYTDMKNCATALYEAVETYESEQTAENLKVVCEKWRAMRIPWEQSEGFLFGPAALLSLDPSLDSWPLDKGGIDAVVSGSGDIDADRIASSNLHGFHAIEYLIFSDGNPKTTTLSEREISYLVAATEYLRNDTYQLWANWVGESKASSDVTVSGVLEEAEIEIMYNFSEQFKKAGNAGSTFFSQSDAIDQIIDGCVEIVTEVGSQKIGGPYNRAKEDYELAVLEVESWYSFNSLDDYMNNIVSIRNSYFGGRGKTAANASSNSISAFVKSKNANLDTKITNAIEAAYNGINSITPKPFRNAIQGGNNASIDNAMDACSDLEALLDEIKTLRN